MALPRDWSRSFDQIKNKTAFYIHDLKQWSDAELLDLDSWLANFPDDEGRYIAMRLLNRFIYYSERDVKRLLKHGLYRQLLYQPSIIWNRANEFDTTSIEQETFAKQFLEDTIFTPLLDRNKPSESGNTLCRYLNRDLEISSRQIRQPDELSSVMSKRVVVVDDFIGSGQQIIDFWNKPKIAGKTLASIAASNNLQVTYLSLVATRYGLNRVAKMSTGLHIACCEVIEDTYRVFCVPSLYLGQQNEISKARGYLDKLCKDRKLSLLGFHKLDFAVAFHHAIPDATLPLFFTKNSGWNPLIKRRQS
jgi:hypothetical protein